MPKVKLPLAQQEKRPQQRSRLKLLTVVTLVHHFTFIFKYI
jgi:hypothetical protein